MSNSSKSFIEKQYKILYPSRNQTEFQIYCLDDLIPKDHKVRALWEFVEKMDVDSCYDEIFTFEGAAGRSTTSPRILLALWIYAIMDGVISARKIIDLCKHHNVYRWIAGGVSVNRTMMSDFRSKNPAKFEELLTSCLAVMIKGGVIDDQDFAQDGTRVKANAGLSSFRREATLEKLQTEIIQRINALEAELEENPKKYDARTQAAQERAKRERSKRVDEALKNLKNCKKQKIAQGKKTREVVREKDLEKTRASTTDPEARKMKMGDGGFRLAFNVQFATGIKSRVIFGADVVNTLDPGTSSPMMQKVNETLNALKMPRAKNWCADSAYSSKEDIEKAAELFPECTYNAPAKLKAGIDPKKHQKKDSESVKKWRDRLDTPEMKDIYQYRCSTAEFSNAQTKNHGLREFLVRGINKVLGMVNLHAISNNITRYFDLMRRKKQTC